MFAHQRHTRHQATLASANRLRAALLRCCIAGTACAVALLCVVQTAHANDAENSYDQETVVVAASSFFGDTSEGLAKVVQKAFEDNGRPNAYIEGEEVSGALGVGLRYGNGIMHRARGGSKKVYWQGPSVGFDAGGNASKVFVLVYHLSDVDDLYQRFPGVEGSYYFVAGFGLNYQRTGDIVLAPIRAGVGLRAGANVGYLHYTRKYSWLPF